MHRDFDAKRYWDSKPWCSVCHQRRVRKGHICHQCLQASAAQRRQKNTATKKINAAIDTSRIVKAEKAASAKRLGGFIPAKKVSTISDAEVDVSFEKGALNNAEYDIPGLSEAIDRKIQQWKERLIDLSFRNRLINFKQSRASTLKIIEPSSSHIYDHLVKEEGDYYLSVREEQGFLSLEEPGNSSGRNDSGIATVEDANELICEGTREHIARVLYTLRSRAQTEFEERGTHVLFIAIGFLTWRESAASSINISSPIILIPIELERQRSKQRYKITLAEEDVIVNPALSAKLKNDFSIVLPEWPENPDDLDIDLYMNQVIKAVQQQTGWKVDQECHLGLFSFLKFMMYKDLEANKDTAKTSYYRGARWIYFDIARCPARFGYG